MVSQGNQGDVNVNTMPKAGAQLAEGSPPRVIALYWSSFLAAFQEESGTTNSKHQSLRWFKTVFQQRVRGARLFGSGSCSGFF